MLIEIQSPIITRDHLESDPLLYAAVANLGASGTITLSVDGILGTWMPAGKVGIFGKVDAIRPAGAMATVWRRMLEDRKGGRVDMCVPGHEAEPWTGMARTLFQEWRSVEDEAAFADL